MKSVLKFKPLTRNPCGLWAAYLLKLHDCRTQIVGHARSRRLPRQSVHCRGSEDHTIYLHHTNHTSSILVIKVASAQLAGAADLVNSWIQEIT